MYILTYAKSFVKQKEVNVIINKKIKNMAVKTVRLLPPFCVVCYRHFGQRAELSYFSFNYICGTFDYTSRGDHAAQMGQRIDGCTFADHCAGA